MAKTVVGSRCCACSLKIQLPSSKTSVQVLQHGGSASYLCRAGFYFGASAFVDGSATVAGGALIGLRRQSALCGYLEGPQGPVKCRKLCPWSCLVNVALWGCCQQNSGVLCIEFAFGLSCCPAPSRVGLLCTMFPQGLATLHFGCAPTLVAGGGPEQVGLPVLPALPSAVIHFSCCSCDSATNTDKGMAFA